MIVCIGVVLLLASCIESRPSPTSVDILEYARKHPNTDKGNPEYGDYFEGDILLSETDSRNAMWDPTGEKKWKDGVLYYKLDNTYTDEQIAKIEYGIYDLVESTKVNGEYCINILPAPEDAVDYVSVQDYSGCSSYIGRIGGSQRMSLVDGCINRHGTIMHEFLHAYGFHHEHKRADRDDYVFVNFDNIEEGKEHNFNKLVLGESVDHLGTGYDYGSVLHYSAYGFAIDDDIPTIIPHDPEADIGQRIKLSALDIERVQIFYECLEPADSKYFKHLTQH